MGSYTVTTPDGQEYEVSGDDQKVKETVNSVMSQHQSQQPQGEGSVMSFIRAAGNQMPLGPQFSALVSPGSYSDNMAAQNKAIEQDKQNHPIAYGAGAVSGAVAPALVPGVGEMMAANPMTSGAALAGSGSIANTDLKKNPILDTAATVGTNAAGGALLSGLLGKILPSTQQALEQKANTLANKSVLSDDLIDMTPAQRQAQGKSLRDAGIIVKDKEEAFNKAKDLLNSYGEKIGSIAKTTEGQGLVADADEHYATITDLLNQAEKYSGSANSSLKAIGRDYKAGATDIANLGDNPSWEAIQNLKEAYGKSAFKENSTQGAKDTYFSLSNMLKGIADKAQADPSLGPQYKEALAGYSQMTPIVDNLKTAANAELSGKGAGMGVRGMIGLIRQMPASARAAIGATALATGHPYIAGMAAIPELTNKAIQSNAAGALANTIPAIQQGAPIAAADIANLIDQLRKKYDDRSRM